MNKLVIIVLVLMFTILPQNLAKSENSLKITEHNINIMIQNEKLYFEENVSIQGYLNINYDEIFISINKSAEDIKIIFSGNEIEASPLGNSNYSLNISSLNISQNSKINLNIKYFFDKNINEFRLMSIYDTDVFEIKFDDEYIFSGFNLAANSNILIPLYKPSETPISIYIFIGIFLLVLLTLMSTYYFLRKQKSFKIKNLSGESKEFLSTKKILLMSILKQLEKEYRAKKISDDTYNKLRDYYKQKAVESMKKLEDIESEII